MVANEVRAIDALDVMCILNVLVSYMLHKLFFIPNKLYQLLILVFCYYISILYTNTLKQTKINITAADDATPNPLLAGEEALLDAGEEAAATAMEA